MTLRTTHSDVSHEGNGLTREFSVAFEFHAAIDLEVILVTAATGAERVQMLGFHYQVEGGGGELGQIYFIDLNPPPTSGERVLIRRISSDFQPDDLVDGGALAAEPLERRLDIIAARLQELEADIARSLKVTKGSQATGLDLNLVGGKNRQLTVASDEQGVILTTGTLPDTVQTSQFGEEWVNLNSELKARNRLMLGAAAVESVGTSGATIPLLNGNNTYSGTASFAGDAAFGSDVLIGAPFVLSSESLSIDGNGAIASAKGHVLVSDFEAAGADNLDVIAVTDHPFGSILKLRAGTAGQVPTLRHAAPGSGNVYLADTRDVALDDLDKTIWLQRCSGGGHGARWYEIGRSERRLATALLPHVIDDTLISSAVAEHDVFWDNAEGYLWIKILIHTIIPAADAALDIFLSANGTTFESGASDYAWKSNASRVGSGPVGSNADNSISLSANALLEATPALSIFELTIPFPGDTASFSPVKLSGAFCDCQGTYYTRAALDYVILYQIQKALSPGFLRRLERRVREENEQEFLIPPSWAA